MIAQDGLKPLHSGLKSGSNTERFTSIFRQPAEWSRHSAVWLAWPSHADLWEESLPAVQAEFAALCRTIADPDLKTGACRGEKLNILLNTEKDRTTAENALTGLFPLFHSIAFGDIWLRDTAPIFVEGPEHSVVAMSYRFNGWGEKYLLPHDDRVSKQVAEASGLHLDPRDWVLEGGSLDVDGEGTCLTTEQCLLNPNRNPGLSRAQIEKLLGESLGVTKTIWLKRGLKNDHTDGHIDTLARFVAPGKVLCMRGERNDPNHDALEEIYEDLRTSTDAQGRLLEVVAIPSPGSLFDEEGTLMPASYANFYIGNTTVAVPTYGMPNDSKAVEQIARCFPRHRTVGLSAKKILEGGGAFHCITQQQPAAQGE